MGCCTSNVKVRQPGKAPSPVTNVETNKVARRLGEVQNKALQDQGIQIQERLDTPLITEGEIQRAQSPDKDIIINHSKPAGTSTKKKARTNHYFNISPKEQKKHKIYHISNIFPVTKPYSTLNEWQNEFKKIFPR